MRPFRFPQVASCVESISFMNSSSSDCCTRPSSFSLLRSARNFSRSFSLVSWATGSKYTSRLYYNTLKSLFRCEHNALLIIHSACSHKQDLIYISPKKRLALRNQWLENQGVSNLWYPWEKTFSLVAWKIDSKLLGIESFEKLALCHINMLYS
jgi:hypothetical protein